VNEKSRLHPNVFKVPIDKVRMGYYSDKYFTRYVEVLKKDNRNVSVTYQFFPRGDCVVVGIDEALAILRFGAGYYKDEERAKELFDEILKLERSIQDASTRMDKDELLTYFEEMGYKNDFEQFMGRQMGRNRSKSAL